jgi:hypothetical protein
VQVEESVCVKERGNERVSGLPIELISLKRWSLSSGSECVGGVGEWQRRLHW